MLQEGRCIFLRREEYYLCFLMSVFKGFPRRTIFFEKNPRRNTCFENVFHGGIICLHFHGGRFII
jgi:hypothetical protein